MFELEPERNLHPKFNDKVQIEMTRSEFWLVEDPVAVVHLGKCEVMKEEFEGDDPDFDRFGTEVQYLSLKHSPLLSGRWMQELRTQWYMYGISLADDMNLPIFCAHLYQALQTFDLLPERSWPDMEAFCILRRDTLWIDEKPTEPGDSQRTF